MWAKKNSEDFMDMPSPDRKGNLESYEKMITTNPGWWSKAIRRMHGSKWRRKQESEKVLPATVQCSFCYRAFSSLQAAASHELRAHGRKNWLWTFARQPVCVACGSDFRTRVRLVNHWKVPSSAKCQKM